MRRLVGTLKFKQVIAACHRELQNYQFANLYHTFTSSRQNQIIEQQVENQTTNAVFSEQQIQNYCQEFNLTSNDQIVLKMLLFPPELSKIFGQQGSRIKEINRVHNIRFKASERDEFYPGIQKRVAQLTGKPTKVFLVLSEIFPLLYDIQNFPSPSAPKMMNSVGQSLGNGKLYLQILFPYSLGNQIIGYNGSNIREINDKFNVQMHSQLQESILSGVQTRYFEILGKPENILRAIIKIISDIVKEETYQKFIEEPVINHVDIFWLTEWLKKNYRTDEVLKNSNYVIEFNVDEKMARRLIGRGGEHVMEVERFSQAKIQLVNDQDLESKTGLNKVVIKGNYSQVMKAQVSLAIKVQAVKQLLNNGQKKSS